MDFLTRWTIAAAVCVLISWAAVDEAPDEIEAAQATQDWINDTAAQLVAARKGE